VGRWGRQGAQQVWALPIPKPKQQRRQGEEPAQRKLLRYPKPQARARLHCRSNGAHTTKQVQEKWWLTLLQGTTQVAVPVALTIQARHWGVLSTA
jgi:hypothetical protein